VVYVFKTLNDFTEWRPGVDPSLDLEREHLRTEEAVVRLVALTVETRPDYIDEGRLTSSLGLA
jgi:elongator complex protein 3